MARVYAVQVRQAESVDPESWRTVAEVGFYRIRPPLKPVTLAELATLNIDEQ